MAKSIFLASLLLLASCTHTHHKISSIKDGAAVDTKAQRELLIGRWYAELPTSDGMIRKSLSERRNDGTFTVKFQLFKNGKKVLDQVEAGIWGVSGNIYFTATREILSGADLKAGSLDTADATYYDAYKILFLEKASFKYKSLEGGDEFTVIRAADNFKLQ